MPGRKDGHFSSHRLAQSVTHRPISDAQVGPVSSGRGSLARLQKVMQLAQRLQEKFWGESGQSHDRAENAPNGVKRWTQTCTYTHTPWSSLQKIEAKSGTLAVADLPSYSGRGLPNAGVFMRSASQVFSRAQDAQRAKTSWSWIAISYQAVAWSGRNWSGDLTMWLRGSAAGGLNGKDVLMAKLYSWMNL